MNVYGKKDQKKFAACEFYARKFEGKVLSVKVSAVCGGKFFLAAIRVTTRGKRRRVLSEPCHGPGSAIRQAVERACAP